MVLALSPSEGQLALEALRPELVAALSSQSCVLSAPTGTGKSTLVPRWLDGRVLVIEPRRVACQALAQRVAALEQSPLGRAVGYRVRDDERLDDSTRIVFATPGIALQNPRWALGFDHIILDEFHERRLDTDWLYAYFKHGRRSLLVMSATIDAERIAEDLQAALMTVRAAAFPVDLHYLGKPEELPDANDWCTLVVQALDQVRNIDGDVLVFLPGKGEIRKVAERLIGRPEPIFELHGSLPLKDQARVFDESPKRRIILATNVAETSLTLPNVRVVIDSGLVRRTHYHAGRSYLALSNIAADSAQQRMGRAGRTGPGLCFRLWGRSARLQPQTPPQIHRESLAEFVLWSAACGLDAAALPYLDAPVAKSLQDAYFELQGLGALDAERRISSRGQRLHRLPLDPWYGRILVEAEVQRTLPDAIDLVAALAHTPKIRLPPPQLHPPEPPCDATLLVRAVRGQLEGVRIDGKAELHRSRLRLRELMQAPPIDDDAAPDRSALIRTIVGADPHSTHVARHRKGRIGWASGGTELELGRDSRANFANQPEAIVVLESHAVGVGRERKLIATRASVLDPKALLELGLGEDRLVGVSLKQGQLLAHIERVYAGKVLDSALKPVVGQMARQALAQLLLEGRLFREALGITRKRLQRRALCHLLSQRSEFEYLGLGQFPKPPELAVWISSRVAALGFESGEDLPLLSDTDFLIEDIGAELQPIVDREFPSSVQSGDCSYRVEYDLQRRQVLLAVSRGRSLTPPPLSYLPRFRGFRICVEAGGRIVVLREAQR